MIMPIHAIRLSKIKRRKKLPPEMLKNSNSSPLAAGSNGGDERARTADLLVANQALSRLSYIPTSNSLQGPARDDEPARFRSTVHPRHRIRRFMPCASSPSIPIWWAYLDLNQGPRAYQARALTN